MTTFYRWVQGDKWLEPNGGTVNDAFGAPGLTVMSGGSGQPTVIQGSER